MVTLLTKINAKDILENTPEEIDVMDWGTVKVRCPTVSDKFNARAEATRVPGYNAFTQEEKDTEYARRLALKMITEPTFTEEEYMNANEAKMNILLDTVSMWYARKSKDMNEKRIKELKAFLKEMKVVP